MLPPTIFYVTSMWTQIPPRRGVLTGDNQFSFRAHCTVYFVSGSNLITITTTNIPWVIFSVVVTAVALQGKAGCKIKGICAIKTYYMHEVVTTAVL